MKGKKTWKKISNWVRGHTNFVYTMNQLCQEEGLYHVYEPNNHRIVRLVEKRWYLSWFRIFGCKPYRVVTIATINWYAPHANETQNSFWVKVVDITAVQELTAVVKRFNHDGGFMYRARLAYN